MSARKNKAIKSGYAYSWSPGSLLSSGARIKMFQIYQVGNMYQNPVKLQPSTAAELPSDAELSELISWTELTDEKAQFFSGTGVYEYSINIDGELADEYILDLGNVAESARIWINGQEAGVVWSIPFQTRVGRYLKSGPNSIKIEVANLMANRIRYMDQQGMEWRNYHEINFVNIDYKPFDASGWETMPSGLLGPVHLNSVNLE